MTEAEALALLKQRVDWQEAPALSSDELDDILLRAQRYSTWTYSNEYAYGEYVVPTVRNGHAYIVTTGGTTAATEPTWPTEYESSFTDGTVVFREAGSDNLLLWDLDAACHEAWLLKASRAARQTDFSAVEGGSYRKSQLYEHCVAMAQRYSPVTIS